MKKQRIQVSTKRQFLTALRCAFKAPHPVSGKAVDTVITLTLKTGKKVIFTIYGKLSAKDFKAICDYVERIPFVQFIT